MFSHDGVRDHDLYPVKRRVFVCSLQTNPMSKSGELCAGRNLVEGLKLFLPALHDAHPPFVQPPAVRQSMRGTGRAGTLLGAGQKEEGTTWLPFSVVRVSSTPALSAWFSIYSAASDQSSLPTPPPQQLTHLFEVHRRISFTVSRPCIALMSSSDSPAARAFSIAMRLRSASTCTAKSCSDAD